MSDDNKGLTSRQKRDWFDPPDLAAMSQGELEEHLLQLSTADLEELRDGLLIEMSEDSDTFDEDEGDPVDSRSLQAEAIVEAVEVELARREETEEE